MNYPVVTKQWDQFLTLVRSIKPLTPEKEFELAVKYSETGDIEAAQELVVSHLPFVVKVAFQYRHYMIPVQDLIQEGTIGLMKAVKRFDPYRGYRLVSFAVWWIKAYIKNFILKSWNLVKLGTTQAQRKLFFRIGDIGEHLDDTSRQARIDDLAAELKVKPDDVIEVEARIKAREWSLNEVVGDDKDVTAMDLLPDHAPDSEKLLIERETEEQLSVATDKALKKLDPRERFIVKKRYMEDSPWTLQKLGEHFGTSRERVRQLEKRALNKLKNEFSQAQLEALPA
ncbi:MAG TPA: RNA polymerase factor sigma-32 [Desulfomonilaceae bacterium]|nr:RNA polymerase factor sigma-32 [Desulfomonilaceae bacterium]